MDETQTFSSCFIKFRLLSGFQTLSDFGEALAEEGISLEDSIFSHWQRGARVPRDRRTILFIIKVFVKYRGITNPVEASMLLESADCGSLTSKEVSEFFPELGISVNDSDIKIRAIQECSFFLRYYLKFFQWSEKNRGYGYPEIDSEIDTILEVVKTSLDLKLYESVTNIWPYLATYLWDVGRWDELELLSLKLAGVFTLAGRKTDKAIIYGQYLSRMYYWQNQPLKAEKYILGCLDLLEHEVFSPTKGLAQLKKGLLLEDKGLHQQAVSEYKAVLAHAQQLGDKTLIARTHIYMAGLHSKQKRVSQAKEQYEMALQISQDNEHLPRALQHLGVIYFDQGQTETARKYLSRSLEIREKTQYRVGIAWVKKCLAVVNKDQALENEAQAIFKTLKVKHLDTSWLPAKSN